MSDQHGATEKSKKKTRVTIPVSQKNFNRVKFFTHTKEKVLTLEGYIIKKDGLPVVLMGEQEVLLASIDLCPRNKIEVVTFVAPAKEKAND